MTTNCDANDNVAPIVVRIPVGNPELPGANTATHQDLEPGRHAASSAIRCLSVA